MKEGGLTQYMTSHQMRRKKISTLFSGASKSSMGKYNAEGTETLREYLSK
jgi:hypothetical protein